MNFKIVVPLFNAARWIGKTIQSIKSQTNENFTCLIVDDASGDGSADIAKQEIGDDIRFHLIVRKERKKALYNIFHSIIILSPNKEDVVLTVDGDDWLAHNHVLEMLNATYQRTNCWMTYGNYMIHPSGAKGTQCRAYPAHIIKYGTYRQTTFNASHLRTFKFGLWDHIDQRHLKNRKGEFFDMTWDMAFMFPMLEMARERAVFIDDVLYVYNMDNPLNDFKVDGVRQAELDRYIRNMTPYERLEEL